MLNKRFYSVCEKYIRFNNKFNRHLISCDYTHEKKSSHFIFYNIYLKKIEIENLQQHIKDEKDKSKTLQLFMNE